MSGEDWQPSLDRSYLVALNMEPAWLQGLLLVMGQESCIFPGFTKITLWGWGQWKQHTGCFAGISGIINLENVRWCSCGTREWVASGEYVWYEQQFSCWTAEFSLFSFTSLASFQSQTGFWICSVSSPRSSDLQKTFATFAKASALLLCNF